MHDLAKVATNRILNQMVNCAIRKAILLERTAQESECPALMRMGVNALVEVLWQVYGGYSADCAIAIQNIVAENEKNDCLGYDSRDYIKMFEEALEDVRRPGSKFDS